MSERLTLDIDPEANSDLASSRVHVYASSLTKRDTGEPLVSLATRGPGLRLTKAQANKLHNWLGRWLAQ